MEDITRKSTVDEVQKWFKLKFDGTIAATFVGVNGEQVLKFSELQLKGLVSIPAIGIAIYNELHPSSTQGVYLSENSILNKTNEILDFPFDYIERDCFGKLQKAILTVDYSLGTVRQMSRQVIQIYGIRRSGKTTIMKQAMRWLVCANPDLKHLIAYIDVPEGTTEQCLMDMIQNFLNRKVKYVFVDEIQRVSNWQSVVIYLTLRYPVYCCWFSSFCL